MFNDRLNVRTGNARRKQAMAKVAAKMMQNQGRASGLGGLMGRAGGGLGKANAARGKFGRPGMNPLARLALGGDAQLGRGIGQFGIVERQPGAFDPGAVPDLGGISALPSTGGGALNNPQDVAPLPGGGSPGDPRFDPGAAQNDPNRQPGSLVSDFFTQAQSNPGTLGNVGGDFSSIDQYINSQAAAQQQPSGVPAGYMMWQGQLIPVGVYKALQASGELF